MKKTKIYFIQEKKYYGYDENDEENIEECMIIGYFTSQKMINVVKNICLQNGIKEEDFDVQCFNVSINYNQKFVYVLSHAYSFQEKDGSFTDYEYIFEPQSNKKNCIRLKTELKTKPKYNYSRSRDYSCCPPDGFVIERYELNHIIYPINLKISF